MKIIKTKKDHALALKEVEALMLRGDNLSQKEINELEVLSFLIEDYEKKTIKLPEVTPAEVLRFIIEQQDLTQKDLVPFIGSKSRVSEVLSGKRELTLRMVRALHSGLDIPLNALIQEEKAELPERIEVSDYPASEMCKLGYFTSALDETWMKVRDRGEELLHEFFRGRQNDPMAAFNKQTTSKKSKVSHLSVHAWRCHVLDQSEKQKLGKYSPDSLNEALFTQLKGFSTLSNGPNLVCERLNAAGIAVVIAKQLTATHLDGAALWHPKEYPVIGMTLRHNRLDNFWFVLFHELGHIKLHLESHKEGFMDADIDSTSELVIERQADKFALDTVISPKEWKHLEQLKTADEIRKAASKLAIHESIIAGRLRRAAKDYRKHRTLIGQGKVRPLFGLE